jgi:hypothetical protein
VNVERVVEREFARGTEEKTRPISQPPVTAFRMDQHVLNATVLEQPSLSELLGFGLCPSYGILKTREHNVSETESVSVPVT